jgi:tetratricopeptide (TPR) repeat protein
MDESTVSMQGGTRPRGSALLTWGPFRLEEKVGQGGFGEVYRAWDPALEREVALKLLLPRGQDPDAEERAILREARLIARVRHPNIVPVYGVDRHEGRVGFWSDFVRGKTLSALLAAQGPFGAREAAVVGIELSKALSAVHGAGLLHRDIKAGNAMREEGGRILLMDFGLTHEKDAGHRLAGTPSYLAPELLRGVPASAASDIYAMGVLLYHLVTGKYPVAGATFDELKAAHESGSRRHLIDERPDLPERFVQTIDVALDPDPARRYATAGQLISGLAEALGTGPVSGDFSGIAPQPRRRWRPWMLAPAFGLLALLALLFPSVREMVLPARPAIASAGAHADYLAAQDLLDKYYKPGNLAKAIAFFEKTAKEDPKFALAYAGLGRAYWYDYRSGGDSGLIESAQAACTKALELDAGLSPVHVTLGMIYTQTGRTDLAAQELQQALHLDARSADAYGALGELYAKQGRDADVESNLQRAVDLAPTQWRWRNQLGLYYLSVGKPDAAAEQFQQAVKADPENGRAYGNLGIAYMRQNRMTDAKTVYEKAIRFEPSYNHFINLGTVLQTQGQYSEAVEIYQKAVDLNPSSHVAWGNMGSAYAKIPGDALKRREAYLKAISAAEENRKARPNDPEIVVLLAAYYASIQMAERSLPLLRQAVALAPENPQVLFRVATTYETLKRRSEALRWIGQALAAGLAMEVVERDADLAPLRSDPGFPAATRKVR